jgi:hypothetical protein
MSVRVAGAATVVHKAGCYDECEYYYEALQEAREEAREAAEESAAYAAEEAEEYGHRPRSSRRQARIAPPANVAATTKAAAKSSKEEAPAKAAGPVKDVAVNAPAGCKQYFPATGITLSVPCE